MQTDLFRKSAILMEQTPIQCRLYEDVLTANGFDVYVAKSAMDGLIKIKEAPQDLAIINVELAEESFMEKLISKMKSGHQNPGMLIVGLSIYDRKYKKNIVEILDAFLTKPISIDRFLESIFSCLESKAGGCKSFGS
jgi:DNA-binding NtrC family response regulator